jgi:predicted ATP-grasp superfamily ATP-dependent carboligase
MKRVLVFPCGSEIGLEINKSIGLSAHYEIMGGSSVDDHGKFAYKNYIGNIENVRSKKFISSINEIVKKYNIDFIYPAHDDVLLKLSSEKKAGNLLCEIIASSPEACEVTRSKKKTYAMFRSILRTPKVYEIKDLSSLSEFPIFAKPDVGQGSKGALIINNRDDLIWSLTKKDLIFTEYLPGKEYTVECFTDKDSKLRYCSGRERRRISGGISVNSMSVKNSKFNKIAEIINSKLNLRGCWFFQLKESNDGDLCLLEIAPRVAGTMGLSRCKGVNLPLLTLFDFDGKKVSIIENNYALEIDRALSNKYINDIQYEEVYIDFDDTLIINNKINTQLLAFIFQCINNNKRIILITKHKQQLYKNLDKYRIGKIFDEIIWLKTDEQKHPHIKSKKSIFIDDSFSEREWIYSKLGIPIFDTSMVEGLME